MADKAIPFWSSTVSLLTLPKADANSINIEIGPNALVKAGPKDFIPAKKGFVLPNFICLADTPDCANASLIPTPSSLNFLNLSMPKLVLAAFLAASAAS